MASTYHADIQALYVAYFNRPADYLGLNFWETAIENAVAAAGSDTAKQAAAKAAVLAQISAGFAASDEYLDVYGDLATEQVIGTVYQNLFGHAPDLAGLVFWVNAVRGGHMTIANAVTTIAAGAQGTDLESVQNKTAAAVAFTNELDTGEEVLAYSGDEALTAAKQFIASITTDATLASALVPATLKATVAAVVDAGTPELPVVQHVLTAGIDTIPGTAGVDVITGVMDDVGGDGTFTALDTIDGGTGVDILNINMISTSSIDGDVSVTNVETVNVRSAGDATVDSSSWTGVTTLNITQSDNATVTAGSATKVSVTGATGDVIVDGGSSQTVVTSSGNIALDGTEGAIAVTHSAQGADVIDVDGGSTVTVSSTGSTAGAAINVGAATSATGAVSVTSAHAGVAGTDATLAAINVIGGSTINVTQTATSTKAAADKVGSTVTQGAVDIEGDGTTAVTVTQTATVTERLAVDAIANVNETATVTFVDITAGQAVTIAGLTFTAKVDMTAAEVAQAFSGLDEVTLPSAMTGGYGDTQGNGAASKGVYTGSIQDWVTGAASGDSLVFEFTTPGFDATDLTVTGTGSTGVEIVTVEGVDGNGAVTGRLGVITGAVTIDDATTAAITTVSVSGYANSTIGNTNTLSKLSSLSLANSGGATAGATNATMTVDAAGVSSLNLTLNNIKGAVNLDGAADLALKTLNVTATGASSGTGLALTAASVETMNVSGDKSITLTASTLTALKTLTVTGSAGVTLGDADEADTLTSITTTGTTGTVSARIDGTIGTYAGGAGVDSVTLVGGTALTKSINLGAGNDTLSFGALAVTGSAAAVAGGDGTDTLSMSVAAADGLDGSVQSFYTGFERLTLNTAAGNDDVTTSTVTVDLANLGFTNYVTTSGTVNGATNDDTLLLSKLASNGTVVLTANGLVSVGVTDAATGTADVVNAVVTGSTAGVAAGTLTVANVETINITSTDSLLDDNGDGLNDAVESHSLTLTADKATLVDLSGNANMTLTLTGSTKVTMIDGSDMTGVLNVTSANTTTATTIKGGSNDDILTAATGSTADILLGGAGADTLTANGGMSTLTGGADGDLFVIGTPSLNVNSYASITDFSADDLIQFASADSFAAAKVTLGDTAVFQDYANAAINSIGANDLAWFQFGGNTYIVMDAGADTTTFTNGQDIIVKLTGSVDLSTATFNATHGTVGWQ